MRSYHKSAGLHVVVSDMTDSRTLLDTRGVSVPVGTHTTLSAQHVTVINIKHTHTHNERETNEASVWASLWASLYFYNQISLLCK